MNRRINISLTIFYLISLTPGVAQAYKSTEDYISKNFVEISTTDVAFREVSMIIEALPTKDREKFKLRLRNFGLLGTDQEPCRSDYTVFAYSEKINTSDDGIYFCRNNLALYAHATNIALSATSVPPNELFSQLSIYIIDRIENQKLPLCSVAEAVVLLTKKEKLTNCKNTGHEGALVELENIYRSTYKANGIDDTSFPRGFIKDYMLQFERQSTRTLFEYIAMHEAIHVARGHNYSEWQPKFEIEADDEALAVLNSFDMNANERNVRRGVDSNAISLWALVLGLSVREIVLERGAKAGSSRLNSHIPRVFCKFVLQKGAASSILPPETRRKFSVELDKELQKRRVQCPKN